MVGFKASVQRTGARWRAQLRKAGRVSFKRGSREGSREGARTLACRFKPSGLDIAHRRLVQSVSVWGGAPPARPLLQGT